MLQVGRLADERFYQVQKQPCNNYLRNNNTRITVVYSFLSVCLFLESVFLQPLHLNHIQSISFLSYSSLRAMIDNSKFSFLLYTATIITFYEVMVKKNLTQCKL